MSGIIWTKFFWSDWLSDIGLRRCSFAARGLWMDMLCVAAQHDPIGYVAVAGRGLELPDLARITGGAESEVQILIDELDRNGVFSRDRHHRIYSRRMIRDVKASSNARKNGKDGGNPQIERGSVPKHKRSRPFRRSDSPGKTQAVWNKTGGLCWWCKRPLEREWSKHSADSFFHVDHVVGIRDGGTNRLENLVPSCAFCNHARARKGWKNPSDINPTGTQTTSSSLAYGSGNTSFDESLLVQKGRKSPRAARAREGWPPDAFDQFYESYPNKVGKQDAIRAFAHIPKETVFSDLMSGLDRYIRKTDDRPWCNPSTWLNQHRWLDQPAQNGARNGSHRLGFAEIALDLARSEGLRNPFDINKTEG